MEKNKIFVVEGKTDTQKLKKIFGNDVKTVETSGFGLNQKTINLIKNLARNNEIIVLTDPDGPGKMIRENLNKILNYQVTNVFLQKKDIEKGSKKIGIAEANDQAIKNAINNPVYFDKSNQSLSWSEYLNNDFYLKNNRKIICNYFSFDEGVSGKTLFKWLNWMNKTIKDIKKILEENNGKD